MKQVPDELLLVVAAGDEDDCGAHQVFGGNFTGLWGVSLQLFYMKYFFIKCLKLILGRVYALKYL